MKYFIAHPYPQLVTSTPPAALMSLSRCRVWRLVRSLWRAPNTSSAVASYRSTTNLHANSSCDAVTSAWHLPTWKSAQRASDGRDNFRRGWPEVDERRRVFSTSVWVCSTCCWYWTGCRKHPSLTYFSHIRTMLISFTVVLVHEIWRAVQTQPNRRAKNYVKFRVVQL